ncbi:uncharacterized protein LOC129906454 [Episyrphus balteatus]|uniref:uncharacterized protein LOC129906454 n=1 Tax=Episyrphus balteatus TaxID=286459 RepID=UPI00248596C4|nr:uncharacterized protein LOC129906454 [Episyrphus balteatus]
MFMEMLRFCIIDNNYLEFENKIYQQKQGVPMGSPISPILADIVMEALLEDVIEKLVSKPKIITKYVDDLFAIVKSDCVSITVEALNSFHRKIQFTVEAEKEGRLAYLDVQAVRDNGKIIFDWFKKPTSSGRLINFHSKQPKQVIFNTAQNFINKVLDYSHINFRNKNIKIIENTLCSNAFPAHVINKLIQNSKNKCTPTPPNDQLPISYRSALYIPSLSNRIKTAPLRNKEKTRIAFKSALTLRTFLFTNTKGKKKKMDKSDVVYKIKCAGGSETDCSSVYVGTSKQKLRNRLSGHRSDINNGGSQKTALALHCIEKNHKPNFDDVTILEVERHHNKRMLLEMLHINNTDNAVNRRSDCDSLSIIYNQLITNKKKQSS